VFSTCSGLALLLAPDALATWSGVDAAPWIRLVGIGLLGFGVWLFAEAARRRVLPTRALAFSLLDAAWIIASIVVLAVYSDDLSVRSLVIVAAVAVAVTGFLTWQLVAIDRVYRVGSGEHRVCIAVTAEVPPDKMWAVIADIGNISRYMPSLRSSVLVGGGTPGEGAVRQCEDHRAHRWSERCVRWEPGRAFDVVFDTSADRFPFPFSMMRGGWEVEATGTGSLVRVWWEVRPRRRWLAPILFPLMELGVRRDFGRVVARMASSARGETARAEAVDTRQRAYAC
jgi:hypothetical protein